MADGIATEVEPNFAVRGVHPADGKICVKPYGLLQKLYSPHRILKSGLPAGLRAAESACHDQSRMD